jgi:hypothetical protein
MLSACGGGVSSLDAMRNGLPSSEGVQMNVPKATANLESGQQRQAVQGEKSGFYQVTVAVTGVVNLGTVMVLGMVKGITDNPPTSFKSGVAVWGPYTEPLSPTTYRFTATDNGNHNYGYVLEGKPKQAADSAYKQLLTGNHTAASDSSGHPIRGFGNGTFHIDWDAIASLPDHGSSKDAGSADFTYSRATATSQVDIKVVFTGAWDDDAKRHFDATYEYRAIPGADGRFRFSTFRSNNGTVERLAIESRWKTTGAGRSDVIVTGLLPGTVNECWDQNFKSTYQQVSYDPSKNYGTESTDCAFIGAEYPP